MGAFRDLQDSAFSMWLLGSDSIWAYPAVLTLHTIGLAILVGASLVVDLRLLGIAAAVPLDRLRGLFPFFWVGFWANFLSGAVLFVVQAADRSAQTVFYVKLAFILVAVILARVIERRAVAGIAVSTVSPAMRTAAAVSLVCWGAAIAAGRLMAYL